MITRDFWIAFLINIQRAMKWNFIVGGLHGKTSLKYLICEMVFL